MYFKMSSAICFNLDQPKFLSSGNGLTLNQTIQSQNWPNQQHFQKTVNMVSIMESVYQIGRKHCDNWRKYCIPVHNTFTI